MTEKYTGGGASFDPLVQLPTNRMEILDRFKRCAKAQFPMGVGGDQFCDVIRTWFSAWHQALWHMNHVYGMNPHVNDEIHFFTANFASVLNRDFAPTPEFKWW